MEDPSSDSPTTPVQSNFIDYMSDDCFYEGNKDYLPPNGSQMSFGSPGGTGMNQRTRYSLRLQNLPPNGSRSSCGSPGSTSTNQRTQYSLRLQNFGWDSFHLMDIIGTGRNGVVYQAYLCKERVAVKICDIWQSHAFHEDMLTETRTYFALSRLQGRAIPRLKGAGYTAGGLFALITEFAGSPFHAPSLNNEER